jgi:predicted ATPase/DNA-binding SARP family transcriptional activator
VRVALLGPFEVRDDAGRVVHVGGSRLRALLARLAVDAGRVVPVPVLVDALWGEDLPDGAANALQSLVSRLRRALDGMSVVDSQPAGYRLALGAGDVDLLRFEELAVSGRRALTAGDHVAAAELLRDALDLWRGPAFVGAGEAPFAGPVVARLDELRLSAAEDRFEADLALGRPAAVVADAEALAAEHPLRERLHGLLIRALYGTGRQPEALATFERLRARLADEFGVDPTPELAAIHLAVLRQDPALTNEDGHRLGNVRHQLTSFVGRTDELNRLGTLLDRSRLVTIVGPGGAGKTRLAEELAGRLVTDLPDGAWLVELAPVTDPANVALAALLALGVRESPLLDASFERPARDTTTRLLDVLAAKRALLVLDNCEHLVDAAARLADRLLAACPKLLVVATSREALGVPGEMLFPIPPLAWPEEAAATRVDLAEYPAVRLFADRAAAVRPGFELSGDNAAAVVEICRRLDGMPLAIELAAARLRSLSASQIAERLNDRFRLLTAGSRTALPQHQTLRAVVAWSWELLDEPEQVLARRLAVFTGGVTIEAAEAVCAGGPLPADDVLDTVGALVDKSLLEVTEEPPGRARYRMLETVRAYCAERLAEAGEARMTAAAHAEFFTGFAETAEPLLRTHEQLTWLAALNADNGNLLAALRWAIDTGPPQLAVRLAAALSWYWFMQGRRADSRAHLADVVDLPGDLPEAERALVAAFHCVLAFVDGDFEGGRRSIARATELAARADSVKHPLLPLLEPIVDTFSKGRRSTRTLDTVLPTLTGWGRAVGLMFTAFVEDNEGNAEQARRATLAARDAFAETGDRWGRALTARITAAGLAHDGDHAGAITAYRESLALVEQLGSVDDVPEIRTQVAVEQARLGDLDGARAELTAALGLAERYGQPEGALWAHCGLAEVCVRAGDLTGARHELDLAMAAYRRMPFTFPQAHALILATLARIDVMQSAAEAAVAKLAQAVEDALWLMGDMPVLATVVDVLAGVELLAGDAERAAITLGIATGLRGGADVGTRDLLRTEELAKQALGTDRYELAYRRGAELPKDEAIAAVRARLRDHSGPAPVGA